MRNHKIMLTKALLPVLLFLFSCATTQQWQPVSEGQIIYMGTYSVKAPLGEGWEAEINKEKRTINFIRAKKKALGILGGATVVKVFSNKILERWHLKEEEVADDYRNMEEQDMIEKGVKTGVFKLEDVKKGITTIDGTKLYFMSYKTIPGTKPIAQEAILYLYFPQDFKKMRTFYGFLISEFPERFSPTKPDLTQIYPVIKSLQIVDPLASLTGINGDFIKVAARGNITAVKDLLDKGADINADSPEGSALMLAAFFGHIEVVRFLINKGADVNRKVAEVLDNIALMSAIEGGETEIAKLLIEKGSDINAKSTEGNTALMIVAGIGDTEIAKLLIEKGADVNVKNISAGATPLIISSRYGHIEIVKLLINKDADINAQMIDGWTALMDAIDRGHLEIAKLLIEKGADANLKSKKGWTALMAATWKGHAEIAKLLIEKGADVNAKDERWQTSLTLAAAFGNAEIVKILIASGVDINAKLKDGATALTVAKKWKHPEIVRLLEEAGAKE